MSAAGERGLLPKAPGGGQDLPTQECRAMWTRVSAAVLVAAVAGLGALPGTGEATHGGGSHSDAVLYELTEHALFKDGLRVATSSLEGSARRGSPLCPEGLQAYAKAAFA